MRRSFFQTYYDARNGLFALVEDFRTLFLEEDGACVAVLNIVYVVCGVPQCPKSQAQLLAESEVSRDASQLPESLEEEKDDDADQNSVQVPADPAFLTDCILVLRNLAWDGEKKNDRHRFHFPSACSD